MTYNVGPSRSVHSPCALLTSSTVTLAAGDVVVVDSGTYNESCVVDTLAGTMAAPITLQGAPGARPVMDGTGQDLSGAAGGPRAVLQFNNSAHWVVQHLEFVHGTNTSQNAAGVRVTQNSSDINFQDLSVHDNQIGVTSDSSAVLTLSSSEVYSNGVPGSNGVGHNLFLAGEYASVVGNYIHDAQGGQNVRLRTHYGELLYNTIANAAAYEIDLVHDGDSETLDATAVLIGNVVVRLATATNVEQTLVFGVGTDTPVGRSSSLYAVFNTFILRDGRNRLIRALPPTPGATVVFSDNAVHGIPTGTLLLDGAAVAFDPGTEAIFSGSNNWVTLGIAPPAPLTATLTGANPGFTSATVYTLLPTSPLLDQGVAPAMYLDDMGVSHPGVPSLEIQSPLGTLARMILGPPDIGAFEGTTRALPDAGTDGGAADASMDAATDAATDTGVDVSTVTDISAADAGSTDVAMTQATDAGSVPDARSSSDAAPPVEAGGAGSGSNNCGCLVPGGTPSRSPWALLGVLSLAAATRRRISVRR